MTGLVGTNRDKLAKFVIIMLTVAKAPFSVRDLKKKPIEVKRREVTFNEAEYTRWPRKEYSGPQDDGTCSICPALLHSCLGAARRSDARADIPQPVVGEAAR